MVRQADLWQAGRTQSTARRFACKRIGTAANQPFGRADRPWTGPARPKSTPFFPSELEPVLFREKFLTERGECLQYLVRSHEKDGISYNTALLLRKIDDKAEAVKDLAT